MSKVQAKLQYGGSLIWLIFWVIVFFPVALILLFTSVGCKMNETSYHFQYDGSRFWLCFWTLVFFPVAFLLAFLNGFSVTIEKDDKMTIDVG